MRDVMKIIMFVLDELYDESDYMKNVNDNSLSTISCKTLIKCYVKFIKMYITSRKRQFNEDDLKRFKNEIIDWSNDFVNIFKQFSPSNLQLPKLHMWRYHTIHTIRRYGALNGLTTETYETLHKNWVKTPYRISNKKDEHTLDQMLKTIRRQIITSITKKPLKLRSNSMKSLLWKLQIGEIYDLQQKLEHDENIDNLCIEGIKHLISCLDVYLDDVSNASASDNIYLKIYANGTLENGEIIYAVSKFHGYARFSDVAITMDNIDYLTDDGLCYGKILMLVEVSLFPNHPPLSLALIHWYDYYSKRFPIMYEYPHMKFVNHYDLIPFDSIAGLAYVVKRFDYENEYFVNKFLF
ncbi:hypothetical protein RirG_021600 [Rhizophagus irregularis DAOM 197198w]|uniref:Uncharacterized protein n=1 Tax=Rhizophagus irregularis (strain DAOM 197198w) TaxID=1432141 RepID=A0A015LYC0_RHIIW|nr:hypothetical protein RirG_021600 [Rhizophagus irregularis DAOM 197198w]